MTQFHCEVCCRAATLEDVAQIMQLLEPDVLAKRLLRRSVKEVEELTRYAFVAEANQQIIGFCAVEIYSRKLAEIQCLVVDKTFRSQGVGRELVRLCLEIAQHQGVLEVLAITSSEDFLRSCGFDYALPDQKKALFCQLRPRHASENFDSVGEEQ